MKWGVLYSSLMMLEGTLDMRRDANCTGELCLCPSWRQLWLGGFSRLVEENEGCESDRSVELRSKECVGDGMGEFCIRAR